MGDCIESDEFVLSRSDNPSKHSKSDVHRSMTWRCMVDSRSLLRGCFSREKYPWTSRIASSY